MSTATATTTTHPTSSPSRRDRQGFSWRRFASMARAELTILLRNKVAAFYAIALGPLMVLLFAGLPTVQLIAETLPAGGFTALLVSMLTIFGLTMAIYYNLTTAVVARREKLMLKRLISGESTRGEVLYAIATPNIVIFLFQFVAVFAASAIAFGSPAMVNPALLILALVLGVTLSVALAYLTGIVTRTVEAAQLTTMPGMMIALLASGVLLPASLMPPGVIRVLELLPFYPMVELITLGLTGADMTGTAYDFAGSFGAAAFPLTVLAIWTVLTVVALRRWMRWEPRR